MTLKMVGKTKFLIVYTVDLQVLNIEAAFYPLQQENIGVSKDSLFKDNITILNSNTLLQTIYSRPYSGKFSEDANFRLFCAKSNWTNINQPSKDGKVKDRLFQITACKVQRSSNFNCIRMKPTKISTAKSFTLYGIFHKKSQIFLSSTCVRKVQSTC